MELKTFENDDNRRKEINRKYWIKRRASWTPDQLAAYNREGAKRALKWRRTHREEFRISNKKSRKHRRIRAIQIIMDAHNFQNCMASIHPNIPEDLKEHKCWGKLTLEHPNGGGRKEYLNGRDTFADVLMGRRDPKELMVLCQLHQIWNSWPSRD